MQVGTPRWFDQLRLCAYTHVYRPGPAEGRASQPYSAKQKLDRRILSNAGAIQSFTDCDSAASRLSQRRINSYRRHSTRTYGHRLRGLGCTVKRPLVTRLCPVHHFYFHGVHWQLVSIYTKLPYWQSRGVASTAKGDASAVRGHMPRPAAYRLATASDRRGVQSSVPPLGSYSSAAACLCPVVCDFTFVSAEEYLHRLLQGSIDSRGA